MKKTNYVLSKEVAEEQLDSLFEYYEIDFDEIPKSQEEGMNAIYDRLVKAIRMGRLEIIIEDGIKCIQTLKNSKGDSPVTITYREIDGRAKTAMGTKSDKDGNGRIYAVMGALSDGEASILKLKGVDISLVENLGAVFLLV